MPLLNSLRLRRLLVITLVYFIMGKLGLLIPNLSPGVTMIWLPSGIAVAALMRWGYFYWPAIFVGAFLADGSQTGFAYFWVYCGIGVGSTVAALLTTWLLKRFKFSPTLNHIRDIALMALFAGLGTVIAATFGIGSLVMGGIIPTTEISESWMIWWAGDTVGVLLALPTLLNVSKDKLKQLWKQSTHYVFWVGLVFTLQLLIFRFIHPDSWQFMLLAFIVLPLVIWVTMRFGLIGAALLVLGLSVISVWSAADGQGPFSQPDPHQTALELWVFMSTMSLVVFLITVLQAEWQASEKALRSSEAKLRAVIEGALDAIVTIDENGHLVEFNPAAERIFGYQRAQVIGRPLAEVIIPPQHRKAHAAGLSHYVATGEKKMFDRRLELTAVRSDGSEFPVELTITSLDNSGFPLMTGFIRDITERKQAEQEIRNLAFFDALTTLPNRRLLLDRLEQALNASNRTQMHGAVIFIDLDNFKALNDTRGHAVGDLLLIEVAQRLRQCVRAEDTVARLGGDEFVILLEDLSTDITQSLAQVKLVSEKVQAAINQPYSLQNFEHHNSSSIGISTFCGNDVSPDDLLKRSDTAMYQAKNAGRNTLMFFDPAMQANLEKRISLEAQLRIALAQNQFRAYFQPQLNSERNIFGAELLIRWEHPQHGLILPMEFIPIAEDTGLIVPIGHWVLQQACEQIRAWQTLPQAQNLRLAVNVSARQFKQRNFVDELTALIVKTGANPELLELELTESTLLDNVEDTVKKMFALRAVGVHFSMDDFGTGYSSLSYLKQLPLTQVKIDKSFVRDIAIDANDAAIVQAIIGMSQTLGLSVIAEGVETEAQFDLLREYGCRQFQGYMFAKPAPLENLEAMLLSERG